MKHTHVVEGVGCAVVGCNQNYLELDGDKFVDFSDLFREAGAEVVSDFDANDFKGSTEFYGWKVKKYRRRTGREYPRVYRVKVTVELEELPDSEAKAFWDKRREYPEDEKGKSNG